MQYNNETIRVKNREGKGKGMEGDGRREGGQGLVVSEGNGSLTTIWMSGKLKYRFYKDTYTLLG